MASVTGEVSGVVLEFVAREITGETDLITKTTVKFDSKAGENVKKQVPVEDPIIIFFPNGSSQVMSRKRAEERGFLNQPEILNFSAVQDQKTPAGRYKNAIREKDRLEAWMDLEMQVINACQAKTGHPLPLDCRVSKDSIYLDGFSSERELA